MATTQELLKQLNDMEIAIADLRKKQWDLFEEVGSVCRFRRKDCCVNPAGYSAPYENYCGSYCCRVDFCPKINRVKPGR